MAEELSGCPIQCSPPASDPESGAGCVPQQQARVDSPLMLCAVTSLLLMEDWIGRSHCVIQKERSPKRPWNCPQNYALRPPIQVHERSLRRNFPLHWHQSSSSGFPHHTSGPLVANSYSNPKVGETYCTVHCWTDWWQTVTDFWKDDEAYRQTVLGNASLGRDQIRFLSIRDEGPEVSRYPRQGVLQPHGYSSPQEFQNQSRCRVHPPARYSSPDCPIPLVPGAMDFPLASPGAQISWQTSCHPKMSSDLGIHSQTRVVGWTSSLTVSTRRRHG